MQRVRFLCKKCPDLEWSGVLFYEVEGSIRQPEQLKITLKDLLLMDIGTKGQTSFEWTEEITMYIMDNDLEDCIMGHIHSHNTMPVFFSGTDNEELEDNTPNHNMYLSVIVNNMGDIMGKLAFMAKPTSFASKDENGEEYEYTLEDDSIGYLMYHVCDFGVVEPVVDEEFVKRYEELEEKRNKKTYVPTTTYNSAPINNYNKLPERKVDGPAKGLNYNQGKQYLEQDWEDQVAINDPLFVSDKFSGKLSKEQSIADNFKDNEDLAPTIEVAFAFYVLRLGLSEDTDMDIDEVAADVEAEINTNMLPDIIKEKYEFFFDSYFDDTSEEYGSEDGYMKVLDEVIETYEVSTVAFMGDIVKVLKEYKTELLSVTSTQS